MTLKEGNFLDLALAFTPTDLEKLGFEMQNEAFELEDATFSDQIQKNRLDSTTKYEM